MNVVVVLSINVVFWILFDDSACCMNLLMFYE
jgi:hypothetical protein